MVPHDVPPNSYRSCPEKPGRGQPGQRRSNSTNIGNQPSTEDPYRPIVEICPDAMYKWDLLKDRYDYISPVIEEITGFGAAELSSPALPGVFAFIHPDDVSVVRRSIEEAASTGKGTVEYRFKRKHGEYRWLSDHFVVIGQEEDRPKYLFGVLRDVTERKDAERALRESGERFRVLTQATFEGVAITEKGRFVDGNDQLFRMLGYSREEMIGREVSEFFAAEDSARIMRNILRGREAITEHAMIRKDGERITVEAHGKTKTYQGRRVRFTAIRDITRRKRMEEELRRAKDELESRVRERTVELEGHARLAEQERDRLMTLLDSMIDGVWVTDSEGRIVLTNPPARAQAIQVGLDPHHLDNPLLSQMEILTPEGSPLDPESLRRVFRGEALRGLEIAVRHVTSGELFYRRVSANTIQGSEKRILGAVAVVQDITDQKRAERERARLEEQLREAQKIRALGVLAGGIAHDFNNVLSAIMGNAELAGDDIPKDNPASANINEIKKATMRARDLVREILTFSRRSEKEQKLMHLAPLVQETFGFLRSSLPAMVEMNLNVRTKDDTVKGDLSQVQQVVMNLAMNAAQAMPHGGKLTISLSKAEFGSREDVPAPEVEPGTYVILSVSDTGTGMDKPTRDRIFEPFFTTKEQGAGTGLGLSVVYGIVKSHHVAVTVDSAPGEGSTFRVFLPMAEAPIEAEPQPMETPCGAERVLFVDDEDVIVRVGEGILSRLGYCVTSDTDPESAYKLFSEKPDAFDIVITDQTMPRVTGTALAQKLLALRPDLPIVLLTGYSESVNQESAKSAGIREFLMKPLSKQELAEAVRRALVRKLS